MNPITIIAFHPTGYELRIQVTFDELPATMRRLAARGYTPSREPILTAEGLPICPRHGVPMKQRTRNGDLWFSHKLMDPGTGETLYCRGYASASSPGYDILLPLATHARDQNEPGANEGLNEAMSNNSAVTNGRSPQVNPAAIARKDAAFHTALFGQRP